mmetsp:Transcript_16878/g.37073  ORF Transcript_16878/g.37073 Transcript_16878/m.37073 type:complete len:146 (-) Transcript_16878:207-644(-)
MGAGIWPLAAVEAPCPEVRAAICCNGTKGAEADEGARVDAAEAAAEVVAEEAARDGADEDGAEDPEGTMADLVDASVAGGAAPRADPKGGMAELRAGPVVRLSRPLMFSSIQAFRGSEPPVDPRKESEPEAEHLVPSGSVVPGGT